MKTRGYLRFVVHAEIDDHLQLGWAFGGSLGGTPHAAYAVIMYWPCACKLAVPVRPPR